MQSFKIIGLPVLERTFQGFNIYCPGGHFGHLTSTIYINFRSPFQWRLDINWALIGQAVLEKKIFVNGARTTTTDDDGRTPEHGYTIS